MPVYALEATGIDELADSLSEALGIKFYLCQSPMIGRWYTNMDVQAALAQLRNGQQIEGADGPILELVLNDPEPGYTGPEFAAGGKFLLRLDSSPDEIARIEAQLGQAGIPLTRLKD